MTDSRAPNPTGTPARPATDQEMSKGALALRASALKAGWRARADYAQGWATVTTMVEDRGAELTPTGRVARKKVTEDALVDSVVLRLEHPLGASAVVAYEDGKPVDAWVWATGLAAGVARSSVTAISTLVKGTGPEVTDAEVADLDEYDLDPDLESAA
jgi:hypothetical protein